MTKSEYETKAEELLKKLSSTNSKSLKFHKIAVELSNLYKIYNHGTKESNN